MIRHMNWTPEKISNFWDYLSQFPEHYFTYQFGDILVDRMSKHLQGKHTVLDYGCGVGYLIPHLLKRNLHVTGLEFSPQSIKIVNNKFASEKNFRGVYELNQLLERQEKFDAIFVVELIEHLDDEVLNKVLVNIKKLLMPDGIVIFTTPHNEDLNLSSVTCPQCEMTFHRWQHVRSWTKQYLQKYLEQHGLQVVVCDTTDFSASFRKNWKNFLKSFGKKILGSPPHIFFV